MDLKQITELQIKADELRGFPVRFSTESDKFHQLTKDLVGLFGEIGEFSNVVKKINIKLDRPNEYEFDLLEAEKLLQEELVDSLIYILRISAILEVDLEEVVLEKMRLNDSRYVQLRQK